MGRRKGSRLSEGKRNIIAGLIEEYDIKTAEDIQEALKDLLGGTIQEMMEAELDEHLGYGEYERSDNSITEMVQSRRYCVVLMVKYQSMFHRIVTGILNLKLCKNGKRIYRRLSEKSLLCQPKA